ITFTRSTPRQPNNMTRGFQRPAQPKGGNDGGRISRHRPDGQGHGGEPAEGRTPRACMGQVIRTVERAQTGRRRHSHERGRCFSGRRGRFDAAERPSPARGLHRRRSAQTWSPFDRVRPGTVSLDCVDALVAAHDARNIPYVAATVFGRPDVAGAAKLSIMAAGDSAAIDRVQPLFDAMGQKTYRVGSEPRHANIAKIAGNLMVACAIEATAEAAALLRKYRMSAPDVLDVI